MNDYDHLWRLLEQYTFELSGFSANCVICTICGNLLKEAYSSICGCQFCKDCIMNYLNNDKKQCPGHKDRCKKVLLDMERTVSRDLRTCYDVSKTVVKCPNKKCLFKNELELIEEHLRCCKMKPMLCPFDALGCDNLEATGETIDDHLHVELLKHSQLIIEAVNNINNDMGGLKQSNEVKEDVIKQLMEELALNKVTVEEQNNEIIQLKKRQRNNDDTDDINRNINVLRNDFTEATDKNFNELNILREMINEFRNEKNENLKLINGLKEEINGLKSEAKISKEKQYMAEKNMNENIINISKNVTEIKSKLEDMKKEIKTIKEQGDKCEVDKFKKDLEKQSLEVNNIKNQLIKCSEEINKSVAVKNDVILKVVHDFVWTINDFSKRKGEHFSDDFITNNYKLCLRIWIGSDRLWLFVCVKKGERDDKALWPLKHVIMLSVLNQESMSAHVSERYSLETYKDNVMVFNKPANDQDCRIGGLEVLLFDIRAVRGVLIKDSIIICCCLTPPLT